ncbi:hypothetical protein I6J77_07010 [Rhodanobacter sp. FDAARGOS 1247]|uniref:DUF6861 domain-containing protein n=1 Tax=Rhodanobacter sp. FDAARGOS 1247 TaxID=2778082 RepID=UPI00194F201D|nr:hypothetical protein [Rhodanobacter sp. FDAARGOS 1247]QRP65176.1 hypothetical protein I6J77_07010 [Rhodanobacter sp. FDAARGOS 1247]
MTGLQGAWIELERWAARRVSAVRGDAILIAARSFCLREALTQSAHQAAEQIEHDFHDLDVAAIAREIARLLAECLAIMVATTGIGALLGGVAGFFGGFGAGAAPGAVAGAALGAEAGEWILAVLGLKALAEFVVEGLPAIGRTYWSGIREAWLAAAPPPLPQGQPHINAFAIRHAASLLARGHVAMFVLLLMAIVAYVSKGRGSMRELAEKASNGRLGRKFGEWLLRNESKLRADPRLRPVRQESTTARPAREQSSDDFARVRRNAPPRNTREAPKPETRTEKSVWDMPPGERGIAIESRLAKSEYSPANGWYRVGAERGGYFPLVDFQQGDTLVSLKTVDTTGASWLGRLESHIDDLATNGATVDGQPANMVLDLRVQPGGAQAASGLIDYGQRQGVTVIVKEFN